MDHLSSGDDTLLNSLSGHSVSPWSLQDESSKETQSGLELANSTMKDINDINSKNDLPNRCKQKLNKESDPIPGSGYVNNESLTR